MLNPTDPCARAGKSANSSVYFITVNQDNLQRRYLMVAGVVYFLWWFQGLGIEQDYLAKIFDRFERAVPSNAISGLGLGLYITRQIVEAHGGQVQVESELGKGFKFTVSLPKRPPSVTPLP